MSLRSRIRGGRPDGGEAGPPAPFIVGVARSGTTLLRLMLDAHPQLAIPPETHFVPRLIKLCAQDWAGDGPDRGALAFEFITSHRRWPDFGLDPDDLRRRLEAHQAPDAGQVLRCFYAAYAEQHGKPRWGEKSPPYLKRMARIGRTLPEARFIHVIRDGRDVALSLAGVSWGPGDLEAAAEKWTQDIEKGWDQARKLSADRYLEIRYEDLVTDPEQQLRRVSGFIQLPWDPGMLAYHEGAEERMSEVARDFRPGGEETISADARRQQHTLVSEPPREERAGRWRREMADADRLAFETVAGGMLRRLGYEDGEPSDSTIS